MMGKWDFDSVEGVEAILDQIGGLRPFATRMQVAVGTVQGWKKRGKIPLNRRPAIEALLAEASPQQPPSADSSTEESPPAPPGEESPGAFGITDDDFSEHDSAIEEGIVSAFTNPASSARQAPAPAQDADRDKTEIDISDEIWEHAALPRSTAGQWAILLSIISIIAVMTRPLWADRIDRKLMVMVHGEQETHETAEPGEQLSGDALAEPTTTTTTTTTAIIATPEQQAEGESTTTVTVTSPALQNRLTRLEKEVEGLLSDEQDSPAISESSMREIKSEVDALGAAFDNQAARLDAIRKTLVLQREEAQGVTSRLDAVEEQRDTARLSRHLQALFLLDRLSYALEHAQPFSIVALRNVLSEEERRSLSSSVQVLEKTERVVSASSLLQGYRAVLPTLLAAGGAEQGIWQELRAQIFSVFSLRRVDEEEVVPLLQIERMLEESQFAQAQRALKAELEKQKTHFSAKRLGAVTSARLLTFTENLRKRNEAFDALLEMQRHLVSLGVVQSSNSEN